MTEEVKSPVRPKRPNVNKIAPIERHYGSEKPNFDRRLSEGQQSGNLSSLKLKAMKESNDR